MMEHILQMAATGMAVFCSLILLTPVECRQNSMNAVLVVVAAICAGFAR